MNRIIPGLTLLVSLASAVIARPGLATNVSAQTLECANLSVQVAAQIFLMADPTDPSDLDGPNDNGIACEELPCPCNYEPVLEAIGDRTGGTDAPTATATVVVASASPVPATETATPAPTSTPSPLEATAVPAMSQITPPSTGDAGLLMAMVRIADNRVTEFSLTLSEARRYIQLGLPFIYAH